MALLLAVCSLLLCVLFSAWLLVTRRRRAGDAPLVRSWVPFVGSALSFGVDPLAFLREEQARHGDAFTCLLAGSYYTFVCDPFSFGAVLRNVRALGFKSFSQRVARIVFGIVNFADPRFSVSFDEIHDLYGKNLMGPQLDPLMQSMQKNLLHLLKDDRAAEAAGAGVWKEEGLNEFCRRTIFRAGVMTLFGRSVFNDGHLSAELIRNFGDFDGAFPLLAAGVPLWTMPRAKRGREALETALAKMTLDSMVEPSRLLIERQALFEQSDTITALDRARAHNVLLWASRANSLPAMFWTLFYLLRSAPALRAVRAELEELLGPEAGNDGEDFFVTREQLSNMTVLQSVINETLRLSSASMIVRQANEDATLTLDSGHHVLIRKHDMLALYPRLMHLDPNIYPDPTEFKFDRFLDENLKERTTFTRNGRRLVPYLMPFGAGKSMCPGRHFAVNEIKMVVVTLLLAYELELSDPAVAPPPLNISRAGLGILPPTREVKFRYRFKCCAPRL